MFVVAKCQWTWPQTWGGMSVREAARVLMAGYQPLLSIMVLHAITATAAFLVLRLVRDFVQCCDKIHRYL
jgi:hypothetical protein